MDQRTDPPIVGTYPGSKCIACYEEEKVITFFFAANVRGQDIYNHYRDKAEAHFTEVGLNFPESKWKIQDMRGPQLGVKMGIARLPELRPFLKLMEFVMKQDVTQLFHHGPEFRRLTKSSQIPMNGLIRLVQIDRGDESISDYSFIKIYYSTDSDENKRIIEMINKQYKNNKE